MGRLIATVLALGATLLWPQAASAEPAPTTEPAEPAVPPNATMLGPLAQSGSPTGPAGLPPIVATSGSELLLGQAPAPTAPGTEPGAPPALDAWNNAYLLPQHVEPAAPGAGTVVGVPPGSEYAGVAPWDYLRRLHGAYQAGGLTGAFLGQAPADQRPELADDLPG